MHTHILSVLTPFRMATATVDGGMRLMGYGVIILPFAFRPLQSRNNIWLRYGLASVVLALANMVFTNSAGANDPRYQKLAYQLEVAGLPDEAIFTNSFHLLDIHIQHPTVPTNDPDYLELGSYFLWVSLPRYDVIATVVTPIPRPEAGWCEIINVPGAMLFQKC